ncbi:MAG: nitroreductase family protein [Beijerinckiaceae bacterium]|nr:nitroreductase family protein [Beijerinckiaceae bacterium]
MFDRRKFAIGMPLAALALAQSPARGQETKLTKPAAGGGMPLMEALAKRKSQRSFAPNPLAPEQMSQLLWAAFGVNRAGEDGRTAPSWRGSKETDIYIATAEGVTRYDPTTHGLSTHSKGDIRAQTGRADFPATAPAVLIYVADLARMAKASLDEQKLYAHVDAALIAQNVYLFAASEGLATVMLGNVDKAALAKTLNLPDSQIVTFTQPIGRPA